MLNIDILKSDELEVTDSVLEARRKFYVTVYKYGYIIFILLFVLGFLSISYSKLGYIIIIISGIGTFIVFEINKIGKLMVNQEELAGIKFMFDEHQKIQQIFTIHYRKKHYNEFIEKEVRFTQAIGFRIYTYDVLQHPSKLLQRIHEGYFLGFIIEIIYDSTIRGIDIFMATDEYAAAQFLKLITTILPKKKTMIYSSLEVEQYPLSVSQHDASVFVNMRPTDLEILQIAENEAIVPREIREFLTF